MSDFMFLGSKITADGDCSQEVKRRLLLGRKVMTNLDGILKSRDITLPTKVCLVKAMVFPLVMYGWESWIVKKAEHLRIDAFELWCWRRLFSVPCTARRSNQSILKDLSPGCSLEGMMLKLKLQYFGHLMQRVDSLEKTLMLGRIAGRKRRARRDGWMASPTRWTWVWLNSGVGDGQGGLACCDSWGCKAIEMNWAESGWLYVALTYSFSYSEPVCCSISSSNCCFLTYIDFSRGTSGGQVFPSPEEFSTVFGDPHSQRLYYSI